MRLRDLFRPIPIVIMIAMGLLIAACGLIRNTSPADLAAPLQLTQSGPLPVTPITEETPAPTPVPTLQRGGELCNGQPLDIQWTDNKLGVGAVRTFSDVIVDELLWAGGFHGEVWVTNLKTGNTELCAHLGDFVINAITVWNGKLWIGLDGGPGVVSFDLDTFAKTEHTHSVLDNRVYCLLAESGKLYVCTWEGVSSSQDGNNWTGEFDYPPDGVENFHQLLLAGKSWWMCSIRDGVFHRTEVGEWFLYNAEGEFIWENGWRQLDDKPYPQNCRDLHLYTIADQEARQYVMAAGDEKASALMIHPVIAPSPKLTNPGKTNLSSVNSGPMNGLILTSNSGDSHGGAWWVIPITGLAHPLTDKDTSIFDSTWQENVFYLATLNGFERKVMVLP